MTKLTCDICLDLIPIVKDGVASIDSERAVNEHIATCSSCAEVFSKPPQKPPVMNEKRILNKMRSQIMLGVLILIAVGVLFGVSLSMRAEMFYNILIMPTLGAVGYFVIRKQPYLVPMFVFVVAWLWHTIAMFAEGDLNSGLLTIFVGAIYWAFLYAGLSALGILVAFLLHYAFERSNKNEKIKNT